MNPPILRTLPIAAYTTRPALRRRFVPDRLGRPTTFTWVAYKRDLDFMW
jgi:hypothetical protein